MRKTFLILATILILTAAFFAWDKYSEKNKEVETVILEPGYEFPVKNDDVVVPDNSFDDIKIKETFSSFLAEKKFTSQQLSVVDYGLKVPLNEGMKALNAEIQPDINNLLSQGEWDVYRCENEIETGGRPSIAMSLRFSLLPNYSGDLYSDQLKFLSSWESSFVDDLKPVLLPPEYFGILPKQTSNFVMDSNYTQIGLKKTPQKLSDTSTIYIGYVLIGDELIIGNSASCIVEVQELMIDLES